MGEFSEMPCRDASLPSPEQALLAATGTAREPRRSGNGNLLELLRTSRVLFYPGAHNDISPALRFACTGSVDAVVYCDYYKSLGPRVVENLLSDFIYGLHDHGGQDRDCPHLFMSHPTAVREVRAEDLGQHSRADFMPVLRHSWGRRDDDAMNPVIGWRARLNAIGDNDRRLIFLYLDTEAIQTFINVWSLAGLAPLIVVAQDHGRGCLWTRLGGDSLMYFSAPRLPRFLYVGDGGTEPWPHYREISRTVVDDRSMHKSLRSLWECTLPDHMNPESPLRVVLQGGYGPVVEEQAKRLKPFRMPEAVRTIARIPALDVVPPT